MSVQNWAPLYQSHTATHTHRHTGVHAHIYAETHMQSQRQHGVHQGRRAWGVSCQSKMERKESAHPPSEMGFSRSYLGLARLSPPLLSKPRYLFLTAREYNSAQIAPPHCVPCANEGWHLEMCCSDTWALCARHWVIKDEGQPINCLPAISAPWRVISQH